MGGLKGFLRSLLTAYQGVLYVLREERNARLHLVIAVLVLGAGLFFGVSNTELAAIFFAIIMVFTAEIVNTSLEKVLDLIDPAHNEQVKIIKDMAAGAVLVTALGAAAIGIAIFLPYLAGLVWPA